MAGPWEVNGVPLRRLAARLAARAGAMAELYVAGLDAARAAGAQEVGNWLDVRTFEMGSP